jgi:hypothetical protein
MSPPASRRIRTPNLILDSAYGEKTTPRDIRVGTTLAKEVDYLLKNGYKWGENNLSLISK